MFQSAVNDCSSSLSDLTFGVHDGLIASLPTGNSNKHTVFYLKVSRMNLIYHISITLDAIWLLK